MGVDNKTHAANQVEDRVEGAGGVLREWQGTLIVVGVVPNVAPAESNDWSGTEAATRSHALLASGAGARTWKDLREGVLEPRGRLSC